MNQQQAALIVKLGLTDEQIGVMFPDVAQRHYGVVREWGEKGGFIEVSCGDGLWVKTDGANLGFWNDCDYRLATRTVTITGPGGTFEIPEPVREPLLEGQWYWAAFFGDVSNLRWNRDRADMKYLSFGCIHLTEDAARAHADALAKLMQKEGKP